MRKLTAEENQLFVHCVNKINRETSFEKLKAYKHHLHTNTYYHSIGVAYISFYVCKAMRWKCDAEKLIYAALLHDYYLYDCHDGTRSFHFMKHPEVSLENAKRDWTLNKIQENIIRRHMFPCTLVPPRYKESILVNLVDKACAFYELIMPRPYDKSFIPLFK